MSSAPPLDFSHLARPGLRRSMVFAGSKQFWRKHPIQRERAAIGKGEHQDAKAPRRQGIGGRVCAGCLRQWRLWRFARSARNDVALVPVAEWCPGRLASWRLGVARSRGVAGRASLARDCFVASLLAMTVGVAMGAWRKHPVQREDTEPLPSAGSAWRCFGESHGWCWSPVIRAMRRLRDGVFMRSPGPTTSPWIRRKDVGGPDKPGHDARFVGHDAEIDRPARLSIAGLDPGRAGLHAGGRKARLACPA